MMFDMDPDELYRLEREDLIRWRLVDRPLARYRAMTPEKRKEYDERVKAAYIARNGPDAWARLEEAVAAFREAKA